MTKALQYYTRKYTLHPKKAAVVEYSNEKHTMVYKWKNSRGEFYLINTYIKCKFIKPFNQKE
jgi:ssDNA-binding Zn-finger/Zn-ribbon topoisomerase 1